MTDTKQGAAIDDAIKQMFERVGEHRLKAFMASWFMAERDDRKRRLTVVMQLSLELQKIREVSGFATRLGEAAIESVIEGDIAVMRTWAESFAFEDEDLGIRMRYEPLWRAFRRTLEAALVIAEAHGKEPITA